MKRIIDNTLLIDVLLKSAAFLAGESFMSIDAMRIGRKAGIYDPSSPDSNWVGEWDELGICG